MEGSRNERGDDRRGGASLDPLIQEARSDRMSVTSGQRRIRPASGEGLGSRCQVSGEWETMIVGVPREIKADEYRVAMLPVGAEELTSAGHQVLFEAGAGQGSGIADSLYASAGATIVEDAGEIWAR